MGGLSTTDGKLVDGLIVTYRLNPYVLGHWQVAELGDGRLLMCMMPNIAWLTVIGLSNWLRLLLRATASIRSPSTFWKDQGLPIVIACHPSSLSGFTLQSVCSTELPGQTHPQRVIISSMSALVHPAVLSNKLAGKRERRLDSMNFFFTWEWIRRAHHKHIVNSTSLVKRHK